jgi:hypothetical protein
MIEVKYFHDEENDRWNATLVSVTSRTEADMRADLVAEFNRATGESKTQNDFDFSAI